MLQLSPKQRCRIFVIRPQRLGNRLYNVRRKIRVFRAKNPYGFPVVPSFDADAWSIDDARSGPTTTTTAMIIRPTLFP
jgi:hypothetical protein